MSEKVELELKIKGGTQAVKTLGQLEQELSNARDAIKEVEVGSDAFKELATKIQNASSEVKTLEKQMEGLEPQQKAEAFLKMGEGIAGGFAAAQGAMGLMGAESEDLEKIQVKVQSAIAIAQGVRMMSEAALMFTTAKRVAAEKLGLITSKIGTAVAYGQAVALGVWSTVQGVLTGAITASSIALKVLKLAIISTGIGALILGVIALVSSMASWIGGSDEAAEAQKKLSKEADKLSKSIKNQLVEQQKQLDLARELKLEEDDRKDKLILLNEEIESQEAMLKKANQSYSDLIGTLKKAGGSTEVMEGQLKKLQNGLLENIEALKDQKEAQEDLIKTEDEAAEKTEKRIEERKKRSADRRSRRKAEAAELLKLEQELFLMRIEDENERAQAKIELDKQNALEGAIGQEEQILLIKEKYALLEEERKQKLEDIEFEKLIAKNDKFNEENLKSQEEQLAKETAAKEKAAAKQQEIDAKVAAFKDGLGAQGFALAKELGGKNEKIQKGIAVSETIFNTQKAVMRALADLPAPFGVIQAGIHGAMGAAAVKNILTESMGDVSGGGGTPETMTPATTGAFSLGGGLPEQQAVKAFVVTDEMSDSQAQLSDIRRRSTI